MPTPVKSAANLSPGGREGGKHWTKDEVERRQEAEAGTKRSSRVVLRIPEWLGEDARKVWHSLRGRLKGIDLLDNLDTELLAVFCDVYVKYQKASKNIETEEDIKAVQAWARLVVTYADKLGFTPNGRARLAKRRAEKPEDEFGDLFD